MSALEVKFTGDCRQVEGLSIREEGEANFIKIRQLVTSRVYPNIVRVPD
jgi:hypothetical protein